MVVFEIHVSKGFYTTLKARFLDQPQGEVHHVESYFTYQIWLNCLTILPNAEISYHFVTRVHQCDLNSPDLVIAPLHKLITMSQFPCLHIVTHCMVHTN